MARVVGIDQTPCCAARRRRRRLRPGDLRPTLDILEAVAATKLVLPVPNRLILLAHVDPTPVLRDRLAWLLAQPNRSRRFAYTLHPGFADHWRRRP